jgi:hypothetical protein
MQIASFVNRYFFLVLGAGILILGGIAILLSRDLMSFAVLGVAVVFLCKGARPLWLESRLHRDGVLAEASVVRVGPSNLRINFQFQWALSYRYTDGLGQAHEGTSGYLSPAEAAVWKPGDTGWVRYDRRHPATSVWIGRS